MEYLPQVEKTLREVIPLVHVARAQPLATPAYEQSGDARIRRNILAAYALTAFLLTAAGPCALLASIMDRRRRQIGLRIALGASPARVLRLVLAKKWVSPHSAFWQVLLLVFWGLACWSPTCLKPFWPIRSAFSPPLRCCWQSHCWHVSYPACAPRASSPSKHGALCSRPFKSAGGS